MRWLAFPVVLVSAYSLSQVREPAPYTGTANGTVFEDKNKNGRRDEGEPGIGGVYVSNQLEVAKTDRDGNWKLPHSNDTIFFVVKPRNWMTAVDHHKVPRFYYVHKPASSP